LYTLTSHFASASGGLRLPDPRARLPHHVNPSIVKPRIAYELVCRVVSVGPLARFTVVLSSAIRTV